MKTLLLALAWAISACGNSVPSSHDPASYPPHTGAVVLKPQTGGVFRVALTTRDIGDTARARAALDLRCQPDEIRVRHVATLEMVVGDQLFFVTEGCGQAARYACVFGNYDGPWCVREPTDAPR